MKLKRGIIPIAIIGALLVSLFAPLAVSADPSPVLPTSFYGDVTVNDTAALVDTVITGRIVDAVGSPGEGTITVTEEGKYGVSGLGSKLAVKTDSLDDVDKEIEFYVKLPDWTEAQKADPYPTATYDSDTHQVDLTVTIVDTTPPTVTIASTATPLTNTSPIPMTATFSEDVTGFELGDIDVTNGTAGNFAGSGADYTFEVTATGEVAVTVDIAAGVAEDAATNGNEAAPTFTIDFDDVAPTVTIASTATSPTNTSPIPMTATFSEDVTGFVVGDITVTNGTASNFAGSGAVYTFDVTPTVDGAVTVDIAAGVAQDAATNPNEAATQFSIIYSINPTVVISSTASDPTDISPIPVTATFSETVTGFVVGDITVGNGAASNFVAVSGLVYTFDVTPVAEGAVTVDIAAGVAIDAATNPNEAATQFSIIYSTETFTITATAGSGGTISPSGAVVVNSGASQAFTITPNTGYVVDDVLVDGISVGAVSSYTFANVTAGHTIYATFAAVIGDLGELVDDTPSGGTLTLGAGTYSGNVTISQSITITGTVGETIISGGILIKELPGSEFTIENVTITDYTAYGIWIELVGADDVFTIRNNTILGVEGSVVGIKVDEVEAGGILDIEQNSISGNETGINLLADVAAGAIEFNNIVDNEVGLELLMLGEHMVNANMNWWGDISGPEEGSENPGGIGDKIELPDGLSYYPWLTREFQTVLDDHIAYFGYPMVWLYTGWNIMSTPVALDPACDTWGEYVALGDGLDTHAISPAYRFDSQTQAWVALTSDDTLDPCDAIYVRMASDDIAAIVYSPNLSVPSKELYSGWNLVSLAWLHREVYGMPTNEALVTVEQVAGGLTGYKLVVSPGVNAYEPPWIYIAGDSIEPWTPGLPLPDGWMWMTSGYWVFMLNDGTLAGFTFTPISLW